MGTSAFAVERKELLLYLPNKCSITSFNVKQKLCTKKRLAGFPPLAVMSVILPLEQVTELVGVGAAPFEMFRPLVIRDIGLDRDA